MWCILRSGKALLTEEISVDHKGGGGQNRGGLYHNVGPHTETARRGAWVVGSGEQGLHASARRGIGHCHYGVLYKELAGANKIVDSELYCLHEEQEPVPHGGKPSVYIVT